MEGSKPKLQRNQMKKTFSKTKIGFTLVEIMIALAVLLILGTIALMSYFKFLDHARETVCETNLKGLHKAVEMYIMENEALPAILGELERKHFDAGYEFAMQDGGWKSRAAQSFLKISVPAEAHASILTYDNFKDYGATRSLFICSADSNGGTSYSLNSAIAGKDWRDIEGHVILIADGDSATFDDVTELAFRHGKKRKAMAITKSGVVIKVHQVSDAQLDSGDEYEGTQLGTEPAGGENNDPELNEINDAADSDSGNEITNDTSIGSGDNTGKDSPLDKDNGQGNDWKVTDESKDKKDPGTGKDSDLDKDNGQGNDWKLTTADDSKKKKTK